VERALELEVLAVPLVFSLQGIATHRIAMNVYCLDIKAPTTSVLDLH
jgi:hypothetical protein